MLRQVVMQQSALCLPKSGIIPPMTIFFLRFHFRVQPRAARMRPAVAADY